MNEEDFINYLRKLENQSQEDSLRLSQANQTIGKMSAFPVGQEQNLVQYQLSPEKELDRLYHLLSGHIALKDQFGGDKWVEPKDDRLKIFSDYGVNSIMNLLSFYININTLLSNYDERTIIWKVKDQLVFGGGSTDVEARQWDNFSANITGGFDNSINLLLVAITIFILAIAISALLMLRGR